MKGLTGAVGAFKWIVESPPTKALLRRLAAWCEREEKSRLEVALEIIAGVRRPEDACIRCRMTTGIARMVIKAGAHAFGASLEEIRERMRDPHWRRALLSVIRGLEVFGVRRPFVPGAPFLVVWDVTYACNLRCRHCYSSAGQRLPDELTTQEAKRVIDILWRAGVVSIAWSGGEPLVRPDIFELSSYAHQKGIYVAMATNGTLLDERTVEKLWGSGVRFLQISLDGATPETHDGFRGIPGAWEKTVKGIKLAVKKGFFVNVATTVTKINYREIPAIIDLVQELGAQWFMAYNLVPTGRGVFIEQFDLSPEEREELLATLWQKLKSGGEPKVLTTAPQFARIALQAEGADGCAGRLVLPTHFYDAELSGRLESLADFIGGCGAGRFYIGLSPNGDIRPCVFFPKTLANILELDERFEEWWRSDEFLWALRDKDSLKEPCGTCEFRYVCGGCRARAYGYLGDPRAPDPGCVIVERFLQRAPASVSALRTQATAGSSWQS